MAVALQPKFNVSRYMGIWYNAASIPQPFDVGIAWERAKYDLGKGGKNVIVENTGYNADGTMKNNIIGTVKILSNSALRVEFPTSFLFQKSPERMDPQVANYLVHATNYNSYAIVGSYDKSNLYILVRNRPINREFYESLVRYCSDLGYDVEKLKEGYGAIY